MSVQLRISALFSALATAALALATPLLTASEAQAGPFPDIFACAYAISCNDR